MPSSPQLTDRSLARSSTFRLVQGVLQEEHAGPAQAAIRTLAQGTIIDSKFRIADLLGEGGMGAVYRARHLTLGSDVALKTFRSPDLSPAAWERFQREVKAIAMLDNKNIVRVFDSGIDQTNVPYYTMELLTGESLAHRIRRQGPLPLKEAISIFTDVAEALVSAHSKGIVHRDLKPENIFLILKDNQVQSTKLVDFGIAKLTDTTESDAQRLTRAGTVFGSPLYMSPEQSLGEETDGRSDIYSYGCAFYEALTGRPPFIAGTAFATILCHQNNIAVRIDECAPGQKFPPWLPSLLARMLAKAKDKRVQSFQEILDVFSFYRKKERKKTHSRQAKKIDSAPRQEQTSSAPAGKTDNKKPLLVCLVLLGACLIVASAYIFKELASRRAAEASADLGRDSHLSKAALIPARPAEVKLGVRYFQGTRNTNKGLVRVFRFPPLQPVGSFVPEGGAVGGDIRCQGVVELVASKNYTLVPDGVIYGKGNWMEGFAPDDLWGITFDPDNLTGCNWSDGNIESITHLTGLRLLNLRNTDMSSAAVPYLNKLSGLRHLNVTQSGITGRDLARLAHLDSLTDLVAAKSDYMSDFLRQVDKSKLKLDSLNMTKCHLNDADLAQVAKITSLHALMLGENPITEEGVKSLTALPDLQVLLLTGTSVGPDAADTLCRIKTLKHLELPAQFAGTTQVEKLKSSLPSCDIRVVGPKTH